MLILTITKDDPITIGDATIHLKGEGQVRLAINTPKEVSVLRRRARGSAGRATSSTPSLDCSTLVIPAVLWLRSMPIKPGFQPGERSGPTLRLSDILFHHR
jgi:hypothetical protein